MERSDLELVLAVRSHGSLAGAASALGVAPPAVTKRLAALEARLGQRLFQRTTRRVSPTAEGEAVCERAVGLLQGFRELEAELQERQAEPAGTIRLAATFGFGRLWLGPAAAAFQQRHPRIAVQLQLTEQLPDLAAEGFDGAVWLWAVRGAAASQWVTRRLARNRRVLVAAPSYVQRHGAPEDLEALQRHACLTVRENGDGAGQRVGALTHSGPARHAGQFGIWQLQKERDKTTVRVPVHGLLSSNSGELVRDWCLAGHGIMLRSLWDIAPQLASGELLRMLPAWSMADADIHWLAPWRPQTPKRIRLLVDFLAEQFRDEPWRLPATPSPKARPAIRMPPASPAAPRAPRPAPSAASR